MQFKKSKTFLAAVLAAAMTCSAVLPTAASAAAGTRTKDEAYGDKSYAQRFMSLYDDVVTNGVQNGYMSSTNTVSDLVWASVTLGRRSVYRGSGLWSRNNF